MRERVSDVKSLVIHVALFPRRLWKSIELDANALTIDFQGNRLDVYQGVKTGYINIVCYQSEAYR
jgi:hypothetical protein